MIWIFPFHFPSFFSFQVTVESDLEHPFFVFGQGWSSASPSRTLARYRLGCQQLKVGDVCISLTHRALYPQGDSERDSEQAGKEAKAEEGGGGGGGEVEGGPEEEPGRGPRRKGSPVPIENEIAAQVMSRRRSESEEEEEDERQESPKKRSETPSSEVAGSRASEAKKRKREDSGSGEEAKERAALLHKSSPSANGVKMQQSANNKL